MSAGTALVLVKEAGPARREVVPVVRVGLPEMAWMAGIIDLKGRVTRKGARTRKTPQVVLYINSKDRRIAERMSLLTGTDPEPKEAKGPPDFIRRSCAEHCPDAHVHVGEDEEHPWRMPMVTHWAISGVTAATVLSNLAPYMSTYGDYALDVTGIITSFTASGKGSGAVKDAVARLDRLGWRIPTEITRRLALAGDD